MDRCLSLTVLLLCLVAGAHTQLVCYQCYDCAVNALQAITCGTPSSGGGDGYPTLPTSPAPTYPTAGTTYWPWYPTTWYPPLTSTIFPWGKHNGEQFGEQFGEQNGQPNGKQNGYLCYRIQRYISSQNRYTLDRGCAYQLNTYEATCRSLAGFTGEGYCEFCQGSLCNY